MLQLNTILYSIIFGEREIEEPEPEVTREEMYAHLDEELLQRNHRKENERSPSRLSPSPTPPPKESQVPSCKFCTRIL